MPARPLLSRLRRTLAIAILFVPEVAAAQSAAGTPAASPTRRDTTRLRGDTIRASAARATVGYAALRSRTATRTDTPLRDVPQAVSVVARPLMQDLAMRGIADVVRYMPGVGMAQGEGNRDAPVLRGNTSTGDLFVDGVRDDVQYYRDLYNIERVEAVKGANAMIFGRGGAGGILNRVTKQAGGAPVRALELQGGAWNERRVTGDIGDALSPTLSARVNAVLEQDDSYRTGVSARREGIAPTFAWQAGPRTSWRVGLEHYRDVRTADRGVPSLRGAPVPIDGADVGTFFGDPNVSRSTVTARLGSVSVAHGWADGSRLESRLLVAGYDKFYRNVFAASAVDTTVRTLQLGAYQNGTRRLNALWQTDLTWARTTGSVTHRLLAGMEVGRQATDNLRETGYFGGTNTGLAVPLSAPTSSGVLAWRPSATDASNEGVATVVGLYVQDQVALASWLDAVVGLRADRFTLDVTNRRTNTPLASHDIQYSPRAGLVLKPATALSFYGSWSRSFVPRGGDQLASLTLTNQALDPELFTNAEVGAKWDAREGLSLTAALYQLDRSNVAVPDPLDATRTVLASAQRGRGLELGITGEVTSRWQVAGGYAFQSGYFTQAVSATTRAGAVLANLPRHAATLWQRVTLTNRVSVGAGVQHQTGMYAATDNAVRVPGFTRVDAALYLRVSDVWTAQVNADNLLDARYIASAHNNNNLMPGAPRTVRMVLRAGY